MGQIFWRNWAGGGGRGVSVVLAWKTERGGVYLCENKTFAGDRVWSLYHPHPQLENASSICNKGLYDYFQDFKSSLHPTQGWNT